MTTNDGKTTGDSLDAMDLMDTLVIKTRPRTAGCGAGTWAKGTIGGHCFNALVFPEHAEQPDYELDESRISKLWVKWISDDEVVVSFDRGWDVRPTTPIAQSIVDLLAFGLAEYVYDE